MAISRREFRIHLFEILFSESYYPREKAEEQITIFLENLTNLKEADDEDTHVPYSKTPLSAEEEQELVEKALKIIDVLPEIDKTIESASENWKIKRMNSIDLNILRVATYEILFDETIPDRVAINEAVEIAKLYSGDQSYSFINGVLGKLIKK